MKSRWPFFNSYSQLLSLLIRNPKLTTSTYLLLVSQNPASFCSTMRSLDKSVLLNPHCFLNCFLPVAGEKDFQMNNLIKVYMLIAFSLMSFVLFLFCLTAQTDFSFVVCTTTKPIYYKLIVCDAFRILKFHKCKFQFHSRTVLSYYQRNVSWRPQCYQNNNFMVYAHWVLKT